MEVRKQREGDEKGIVQLVAEKRKMRKKRVKMRIERKN